MAKRAALRILQFGRTGQLGREMIARAPAAGATLTALGREAADLADPGAASRAVQETDADLVVIAAAYTGVDAAETDEAKAYRVNAEAPGEIAAACAARGLKLIHVSTDYVFSGAPGRPWREDDPAEPLNVYGRTKLAGEQAVLDAHPDAVIVRTSWLFSPWGRNFVTTMLRLARSRDAVSVVDDQRGRPTAAGDLAEAILAMAPRLTAGEAAGGVAHFANAGETSWAGFATAIFEEAAARGWPAARMTPIPTRYYPTPAARPANSVLDTTKIETAFGINPRPWRAALRETLDRLAEAGAS